jgi:DNA-binding NarL/FixJ family response regulator
VPETILLKPYTLANGEEYFCNTVREKYLILQQKNNSKLNKHNNYRLLLTGREIEIIILIALEHSGRDQ